MKKILIVVDYEGDFASKNGKLYVKDGDTLSHNIQDRIDDKDYEEIIYTFDTHTEEEYFGSEEQKQFPNIHCEYKTEGWKLYKIKPINNMNFSKFVDNTDKPFEMVNFGKEFFFTKNKFDIWTGNKVYKEWFTNRYDKNEVIVEVVGLAQNYCVFMNIIGLVKHGYKVNMIKECVKGIRNFPDGTIDDSFLKNNTVMRNKNVNFITYKEGV